MFRKILQLSTNLGLELKMSLLIKKISFLNKLIIRYGWSDKDTHYYRRIFDFINDIFKRHALNLQGKDIIEIGSGNLSLLGDFFIRENSAKSFVASDPYRKKIKKNENKDGPKPISFINLDFTSKPAVTLYKNAFDLVISNAVLEHIAKPKCEETIKNINRALKPQGYSFHQIDLKDHFNNSRLPFNFYKYGEKKWEKSVAGTIFYTNRLRASDWKKLFLRNGFQIVYLKEYQRDGDKLPNITDEGFRNYTTLDLKTRAIDILVKKILAVD